MQETVPTLVWRMTRSPPSPIHLFSLTNLPEDSQKTPHSPQPTNIRRRDWLSS